MKQALRRTLPLLIALTAAAGAQAQYLKLHGATASFGAAGQFSTELETSPTNAAVSVLSPVGMLSETSSNQKQFTTDSVAGLFTFDFHPVAWAGVEMNYSYTHYSERFGYTLSSPGVPNTINIPTSAHEATAAYVFHPRHIKFQPFVNVGGGAIYFSPIYNQAEWRGAGLLEAGFEIPTKAPRLAIRVEGRGLAYRAPNFNTPAISSRSWRVTEEPAISAVYRF